MEAETRQEPNLLQLTLVDLEDSSYTVTVASTDVPLELRSTLADYLPGSYQSNFVFKVGKNKLNDYLSFEE
jgi:hypothetical protein